MPQPKLKTLADPQEHSTHRELEILDQLQLSGGSCRVRFLAERLRVSEQTVRRNIRNLEFQGKVRKVHGGVQLVDAQREAPFQQRMNVNETAKKAIAAAVADTICDGDSLFLDVSSTTAYVAMALQNHRDLLVVTNSVGVAHRLATRNNNRVFLAAGELRPHDGGAFGKASVDFIKQFNTQYAILSVGAIDGDTGFMLHDLQEAILSREAMRSAQTTIVACDGSKLGHRAPVRLAEPQEFDLLVTDREVDSVVSSLLDKNDVDLLVAS